MRFIKTVLPHRNVFFLSPIFTLSLLYSLLAGGVGRQIETPTEDGDEPADDGILDRTQVKTLSFNVTKKAQKNNQKDEGKASN